MPSRKPSERAPARIAPLASLPVFYDLTRRPVVVVGGSAGAAWKAELLAAAGAAVTVFAEAPGEEMMTLAGAPLDAGSMRVANRSWAFDDFAGAALVVAEADDDLIAATIHSVVRRAGVPLNIIDRPRFCDFQFGAIVNRSPVVIGISTDGAAPILGQAIRRRIETLLPATIGVWAEAAKGLRHWIAKRIADAGRRRAFWERFADLAFTRHPGPEPARDIRALAASVATHARSGQVTLVGAGPGDPEYLTLKAVRALQSADVILFDDLVADGVLELARREAKRMLVGKRGGRASCRQEDINALMVRLARQGKRVVRLKSGDPMIFGRAGEEIAELRAAGIPVDVVPGVTSALALAARLGVSLTHRDLAHSVRFVTGHARDGALSHDLDWKGLADRETSLVVYMGGRTAQALAERLIGEGLPPSTPVVCAAGLGRPAEKIAAGSLADIARLIEYLDPSQPILLGIGSVFAAVDVRSDREPEHSEFPMPVGVGGGGR
jgi:uroporphyrin-III C-methyltransferase/precorrin-2 dehydrogenase/sirohydrochlorin ferrochelatase